MNERYTYYVDAPRSENFAVAVFDQVTGIGRRYPINMSGPTDAEWSLDELNDPTDFLPCTEEEAVRCVPGIPRNGGGGNSGYRYFEWQIEGDPTITRLDLKDNSQAHFDSITPGGRNTEPGYTLSCLLGETFTELSESEAVKVWPKVAPARALQSRVNELLVEWDANIAAIRARLADLNYKHGNEGLAERTVARESRRAITRRIINLKNNW